MNPFRSLLIAASLCLLFQNCSFADVILHKQALQKAQTAVDLASQHVMNSKYYPSYHIAPPANLMSYPAGISYFNGEYHLFYQHNPYSLKQENLYSGHYVSNNLVHWQEMPLALAPSEAYDKNGILAGSAIVEDDLLYLLYTGNVENKNNPYTRIPNVIYKQI